MKDAWKNNLSLKIVSVLFSIILWWAVMNIDDPVDTKTFRTEVQVLHAEVITDNGYSYRIEDEMKTIEVKVRARSKILAQIRSSHIVATADLREMQGTTVPIRVSINGFENMYEDASAIPRNIQIQTEKTETKSFPITPAYVGTVSEGCVIGKVTAQPLSIEVSGPKSVLGRIAKVVAKVNVSGMYEDAQLQAEIIYYDSAENILDRTLLSSNRDSTGVVVDVEIWKMKNVPLKFDTSAIIPGEGYYFDKIETEPSSITIAGSDKVLKKLHEITIPKEVLAREGIVDREEVVVDITDYLPEGTKFVNEDSANVVVNIILEKAGTKSILAPVRSIRIDNLSEDFNLEFGPSQSVELLFEGTKESLEELTYDKVLAILDLSECTEAGTYEVSVNVLECPQGCMYVGGDKVEVIITEK